MEVILEVFFKHPRAFTRKVNMFYELLILSKGKTFVEMCQRFLVTGNDREQVSKSHVFTYVNSRKAGPQRQIGNMVSTNF